MKIPDASPQAVGETVRAPSGAQRALAAVADLAFGVLVFCALVAVMDLPPFTRTSVFFAQIALIFALWISQKATLGITLGERLCGLKAPNLLPASPSRKISVALLRKPGSTLSGASFLAACTVVAAGATLYSAVISHPVWLDARRWKLEPYFPAVSSGAEVGMTASESWTTAPFFYAMGLWPTRFRDQPVFYTLPYEKGPPSRFIGHIIARWEAPFTRVIFEGPKTPEVRNRDILRDCILKRSLACAAVREEALKRHVSEMKGALKGAANWELLWFKVENPALPIGEEAQGIVLSAHAPGRGQDRFIFITPGGTHQAVIFEYPKTPAGEGAREVFRQAIRTMRVSDDLTQGRAWVNQQLQTTQLEKLSRGVADSAALQKLAEIQTLLLSKASVDPKTFDTYFHIGGTSLMVARYGKQLGALDGNIAATPTLQTLESAHRYAQDVSPDDPRLARIQEFLSDAKKYF